MHRTCVRCVVDDDRPTSESEREIFFVRLPFHIQTRRDATQHVLSALFNYSTVQGIHQEVSTTVYEYQKVHFMKAHSLVPALNSLLVAALL
jgi:hypothetical protein